MKKNYLIYYENTEMKKIMKIETLYLYLELKKFGIDKTGFAGFKIQLLNENKIIYKYLLINECTYEEMYSLVYKKSYDIFENFQKLSTKEFHKIIKILKKNKSNLVKEFQKKIKENFNIKITQKEIKKVLDAEIEEIIKLYPINCSTED